MAHLPDFNPGRKNKAKSRGAPVSSERWYEEPPVDETEPSLQSSSSPEPQGSEGELKESKYRGSGRCGWVKRHKWKVLIGVIVLVIAIVLIAVLVPRSRGGGDERQPTQVSSGNTGETTPTSPPTEKTPSIAPVEEQSDQGSPSMAFFAPAISPAQQAPFVFGELDTGLILNQFGAERYGLGSPDEQVESLSSAVSSDGETIAVMNRKTPGDSAICVSVYRFNGEWRQLGEDIVGDGDISINGIGKSLALSERGNVMVIGFFNSACDVGVNCGRVQVHAFKDGEWRQIGSDIVGEEPNAYSGLSVAISSNGQTIAVGAPYRSGPNGLVHIGKVKVLRFGKNDWESIGTDITGDEMRDQLGNSVSLSADGNIVACGAPQAGVSGKMGYVKVVRYDESTDSFSELGSYISGKEGVDQMGAALALSHNGTELAVSAFNTRGSGIVCVFVFEGVAWIKIGDDIESPTGRGDLFGFAVDIDAIGGRVIVGAPDSFGMLGAAYLFQLGKRGWQQRGERIESLYEEAQLGRSVSISSSGLIVAGGGLAGINIYYDSGMEGPPPEVVGFEQVGSTIGQADKGTTVIATAISGDGLTSAVMSRNKANEVTVCVFGLDPATGWTKIGDDIKGTGTIDAVGKSLALSDNGDTVVIGFFDEACDAGENCGHVRVFSNDGTAWTQLGQDIVGAVSQGFLGWAVACSADGLTVACGAPISHGDTGIDHPGKVRIFTFRNSQWIQIGSDLEGDAEWDHLGSSVALSGDGSYLATGAVQGMEGNLGYVKVYQYDQVTDSFIQLGENLRGDNRTDKFGDSVSLSSDGVTLAVGANKLGSKEAVEARSVTGLSFGSVTVFMNENNTLSQIGDVLESGRTGDMFGYSVAIDAFTVIVGAPQDYGNSGSAHVFNYDGNKDVWIQHGDEIYLVEETGPVKTQLGRSVGVSKTGEVVSVGSNIGAQVFQLDFTSKVDAMGAPASPFAPFAPFAMTPFAPYSSPGSSPGVTMGQSPFAPAFAPFAPTSGSGAGSGTVVTNTDDQPFAPYAPAMPAALPSSGTPVGTPSPAGEPKGDGGSSPVGYPFAPYSSPDSSPGVTMGQSPFAPAFAPFAPTSGSGAGSGTVVTNTDDQPFAPYAPAMPAVFPSSGAVVGAPVGTPSPAGEPKGEGGSSPVGYPFAPFVGEPNNGLQTPAPVPGETSTNEPGQAPLGTPAPVVEPEGQPLTPVAGDGGSSPTAPFSPFAAPVIEPKADETPAPVAEPKTDETPSPVEDDGGSSPTAPFPSPVEGDGGSSPTAPFATGDDSPIGETPVGAPAGFPTSTISDEVPSAPNAETISGFEPSTVDAPALAPVLSPVSPSAMAESQPATDTDDSPVGSPTGGGNSGPQTPVPTSDSGGSSPVAPFAPAKPSPVNDGGTTPAPVEGEPDQPVASPLAPSSPIADTSPAPVEEGTTPAPADGGTTPAPVEGEPDQPVASPIAPSVPTSPVEADGTTPAPADDSGTTPSPVEGEPDQPVAAPLSPSAPTSGDDSQTPVPVTDTGGPSPTAPPVVPEPLSGDMPATPVADIAPAHPFAPATFPVEAE